MSLASSLLIVAFFGFLAASSFVEAIGVRDLVVYTRYYPGIFKHYGIVTEVKQQHGIAHASVLYFLDDKFLQQYAQTNERERLSSESNVGRRRLSERFFRTSDFIAADLHVLTENDWRLAEARDQLPGSIGQVSALQWLANVIAESEYESESETGNASTDSIYRKVLVNVVLHQEYHSPCAYNHLPRLNSICRTCNCRG